MTRHLCCGRVTALNDTSSSGDAPSGDAPFRDAPSGRATGMAAGDMESEMTSTTETTDLSTLSGSYTIDPAHSRIGFVARHAMVTKVRGAFNEFTGTAVLDGAHPENSSATVTIKAASIDTRNEQRDQHLRSNDFLAMDEYPEITFVSTGARRSGAEEFELTGDLTVRGVKRQVT